MKNYRVQKGCHNCGHCDVESTIDDGLFYRCIKDAEPIPLFDWEDEDHRGAVQRHIDAEDAWEKKYKRHLCDVQRPWGICDEWQEKEVVEDEKNQG